MSDWKIKVLRQILGSLCTAGIVFLLALAFKPILYQLLEAPPRAEVLLDRLKAGYNKGAWSRVLDNVDAVITAAGRETSIVDQAKLLKARALMQLFMQDKFPGVNAENDPDVAQSMSLIKELWDKDYGLDWMNVEMMTAIGDYFILTYNYSAAFDAYDYLLNHANFDSLDAAHRSYFRRWREMWRQLPDMVSTKAHKEYSKEEYVKTLARLSKQQGNIVLARTATILSLAEAGQPRAAVQLAMISLFTTAGKPGAQEDIAEVLNSVSFTKEDERERMRLIAEFNRFIKGWDAIMLQPLK